MAQHFGRYQIRPLPKAEYRFIKALIEQYHCEDDRQLIMVMVRLTHEVLHMREGYVKDGREWVDRILAELRYDPDVSPTFELPESSDR